MKLENDFLAVEIQDMGAELTRIYDKEGKREALWNGDPAYWKRHSPILFPNVGKTFQNTVHIGGKEYPAPQHGFARDTVFQCVGGDELTAEYRMTSSEETKKSYPFDFELEIAYRLEGKSILVEWNVRNQSPEAMYFTIGGHPAFFLEGKKEDYLLKFPGRESLTCVCLDLATGTTREEETWELKLTEGVCELNDQLFEGDTLIMDHGQIEEAWICRKDGSPYVGVECKGFPNFGIWSVKGAPFVCLEPWAGRCDPFGFRGDISEKPGINRLGREEVFTRAYKISLA